MAREPDTKLTFNGVEMDVYLSCYGGMTFGREKPRYTFYVELTFPDGDWRKILDLQWAYCEWHWNYRNSVSIKLTSDSIPVTGKKPPKKWGVTINAFKYVSAGGYVANQTFPEVCKFVDDSFSEGIRAAVNGLFSDDPALFKKMISGDLDAQIAYRQSDVDAARRRLEHEEERLAEVVAHAKRYRPKDIQRNG